MIDVVSVLSKFMDKPCLVVEDKSYSYNELVSKIIQIKNILIENKIISGKVVIINGDYSLESIAVFFALFLNKNIIVPIATVIEQEIKDRIEIVNADYIFDTHENKIDISRGQLLSSTIKEPHHLIKKLTDSKHAGFILFSSGSTGKPKAMIHNLDHLIDSFQGKKEKNLTILVVLLFDHIGGINTMLNSLFTGSRLVIPQIREADSACSLIQKYKVNLLPASPTFLNLILMSGAVAKYDLSSLKMITYGTESMPDTLLIKVKETFPYCKLHQTFGTSETGIMNTVSKSSTSTLLKLEDGFDAGYKIVNNELYLRSKTQILGYLNAEENTFTTDGWFNTGDLVEVGTDGFIKILGRSKEIINVGGLKVLPAEVESVILQMGCIKDCIVYGETNAITGQTVVVDVVAKGNIETSEIKRAVRQHCLKFLDRFKVPTKVTLLDVIEISERLKKNRLIKYK